MKTKTTAKDVISKIENSTSGLPVSLLISEALITVEKNGEQVKFRLREFDKKASQKHFRIIKSISSNKEIKKSQLDEIENFGRAFTVADLTKEEFQEIADIYNEVTNYFN